MHTLDLSGRDVKDASGLGNVHTLDLTRTLVTDTSALDDVHKLTMPNGGEFHRPCYMDLSVFYDVFVPVRQHIAFSPLCESSQISAWTFHSELTELLDEND